MQQTVSLEIFFAVYLNLFIFIALLTTRLVC